MIFWDVMQLQHLLGRPEALRRRAKVPPSKSASPSSASCRQEPLADDRECEVNRGAVCNGIWTGVWLGT